MVMLKLLKQMKVEKLKKAIVEDCLDKMNQEMLDRNQKTIDDIRRIQNENIQTR